MSRVRQGLAESRLGVLDHRRGWQLAVFGAVCTVMVTSIYIGGSVVDLLDTGNLSIDVDFYVFWAAAKLALQGLPMDAFEIARLQEAARVDDTDWMPWAYPPGFLMLLAPFGLLPFNMAWASFNVIGLAALALATWRFAAGRPHVLLASATAPAVLPCLLVGQTTVLWAAGLVAALAALRSDRPVLAGVFIGCLTLKPQLGLLIPLALLACGAWRAVSSAIATAVVLAAVPTLVFGFAYWTEMLSMMALHGATVRENISELNLMVSAYSALAGAGLDEGLALTVQGALAALCAIAVVFTWHSKRCSFDLRAAVLLISIPLASPYLWYYESALLAPASLFMWRAGVLSLTPAAIVLGLVMWLGLAPSHLVALNAPDSLEAFRPLFFPVALAALIACLRHAVFRAPGPPHRHTRHNVNSKGTAPCQP